MIWSVSSYYNRNDSLTGLLRKISNQIIIQCSIKISLDDIFSGNVSSSLPSLLESIECGNSWELIYEQTKSAILASNSITDSTMLSLNWEAVESSNIFAQLKAFVQRCRDLTEICDAQSVFAKRQLSSNGKVSFDLYFILIFLACFFYSIFWYTRS